jgi:Tfp pilus assembly protein PilO
MRLPAKWQQVLLQARQEWLFNRRLQVISMVACALIVFWVHGKLNDWRLAKQADAKTALNTYQDTQAVARENEWLDRAKTTDAALKNMRARLWRATSEGEAEAKLRDWLQKMAKDSGIAIERINVQVAASPRGFMWRPVHADIQGKYQAGAWQAMLDKMSKSNPPAVIDFEQLNIVTQNNLFYRLNVTAWFVIEGSAGAQP